MLHGSCSSVLQYTHMYNKIKVGESEMCPCNADIMTVEHLLQHCPLHDAMRQDTWPEPTPLTELNLGFSKKEVIPSPPIKKKEGAKSKSVADRFFLFQNGALNSRRLSSPSRSRNECSRLVDLHNKEWKKFIDSLFLGKWLHFHFEQTPKAPVMTGEKRVHFCICTGACPH